jgi:hypothetical protein
VPPPPGGDPRLVDIDLRERLQLQTIRLFDEAGKPMSRMSGAFFPMGQDPAGDLVGFACHGTETKVPLPRGTTPLLIGISGILNFFDYSL